MARLRGSVAGLGAFSHPHLSRRLSLPVSRSTIPVFFDTVFSPLESPLLRQTNGQTKCLTGVNVERRAK